MKISVLGCGWLGMPLAVQLIRRNHTVKGSTTTRNKLEELKKQSIEPYLLELKPNLWAKTSVADFWNSNVLVLNIPPGRGRDNIVEYHTRQITSVIEAIANSPIEYVLFISSTSVYPDRPGLVTESDARSGEAARDSGNALLQAEEMLMQSDDFKTTVLRFGGLYGGDRHPVRYLAGRKRLGKAHAPVNLIHREDCIAIITQIIEEQITGEIFNAVADGHPPRGQYYTKAAQLLGLQSPEFDEDEPHKDYKIVSNGKLREKLTYQFIYPDPLAALKPG